MREELANAVEWLDDLDSPLAPERGSAEETASARIRRARTEWSMRIPAPSTPPDPAA